MVELATLDDKLENISSDPHESTTLDQRIELLKDSLSQLEQQVNELRMAQKLKAVAIDKQYHSRIGKATDMQLDIIISEKARLDAMIQGEEERVEKLAVFNQTFKERTVTEQAQCFTYMAEAGEFVDVEDLMQTDLRKNENTYWGLLARKEQTRSQAENAETVSKMYIGHLHQELTLLTGDTALLRSKVAEQRAMLAEQLVKIEEAKRATHGLLTSATPVSKVSQPPASKKQTQPKARVEHRRSIDSLSSRQSKELMEMGQDWDGKGHRQLPSETRAYTPAEV